MTEGASIAYDGCECPCDTCGDCELRPANRSDDRTTFADRFWITAALAWFLVLPFVGVYAVGQWLL